MAAYRLNRMCVVSIARGTVGTEEAASQLGGYRWALLVYASTSGNVVRQRGMAETRRAHLKLDSVADAGSVDMIALQLAFED